MKKIIILFVLSFLFIFAYYFNKINENNENTLKVYFYGMWSNFNSDKFYINLLEKILNKKVEVGNIFNSNILIESVFNKSIFEKPIINFKNWKYKIYFTGESYILNNINEYDLYLGHESCNNCVAFPLFLLFDYYLTKPNIINNNDKINGVLIIISNGNSELRNSIINKLEENNIPLFFGGSYRNNIGGKIPYGYGSDDFYKFISKYKYVLTAENTKTDNYITEKIFHGFYSGSVPIYWGASNIDKYFNKNTFVEINDINSNDWVNEIKKGLVNNDYYNTYFNDNFRIKDNNDLLNNIIYKSKKILNIND